MTAALQLVTAFVISFLATLPLRRLAVRLQLLDHPGPRKLHLEPVPYLGGIAILLGTLAGLLPFHPDFRRLPALLVLVVLLGLFDDIRQASVAAKLVGEVAVAAAAVALGYSWQITDSAPLNWVLTVIWLVGLTNSFNLLDNTDGLSASVAAASLLGLAVIAPATAPASLPLAAAAAGFLVVNRPPARMFMGDAGSLMLGFGVGVATVIAADSQRGLHSVTLLALPVAVAIFDTSLVIVSRLLSGRPVQLGGRDHFSHRLRLLGWSQRRILVAAILASAAGAVAARLAVLYPLADAWLAVPIIVAFGGAWLRLLRVDPYSAAVGARPEVISA
jgi:UDP-GlcNAc:undecaprenyl-phosphate/decaprenyl-phosphate GlcNAc-1-phosphate transferase